MSWRTITLVLAVICLYQAWRGCGTPAAPTQDATAECAPNEERIPATRSRERATTVAAAARSGGDDGDDPGDVAPAIGPSINGFKLPAWTLFFAPHPGENMLAYRDRMLPLAQAALAPHRSRVARGRDDFAKLAGLDSRQRAELDAAVHDASAAIQDKVMSALLAGELAPATFKPMTGVSLARDVLDAVDTANRRFTATLRADQREQLARHPFDFADYLLFSARWEDMLGATN